MQRLIAIFANCLAVALLTVPAAGSMAPSVVGRTPLSAVADAYLREAITAFRTRHMNRDKINWLEVTREAYAKAAGAQVSADTYPAINLIIGRLGEKHTFLITPEQERAMETGQASGTVKAEPAELPESERLLAGPTVIRLPPFSSSAADATDYANTIRRDLRAAERSRSCAIILDLRYNSGGNMWPMLNGLSALFRDGVLGYFDLPSGKTAWINRQGIISDEPGTKSGFGVPLPLHNPDIPVAVLIGSHTKSSGEFTAMAFRGRPHSRFFGQPTGGYISVNDSVKLSDGAVIAMSVGYGRDRTGQRYADNIKPDDPAQPGGPTLERAMRWLQEQGCGSSGQQNPGSQPSIRHGGKRRFSPAL